MIDALREFITTYYIQPITHDTGYNPVNTITWALVLVAFLFLTLKLLQLLKIQIDRRFIAAVVPYIVVGATLRVTEDAEFVRPPLSYCSSRPSSSSSSSAAASSYSSSPCRSRKHAAS